MAKRRAMDGYEIEGSVLDRLSELPNSLILLILSFLPMRDVVSTTLLSKRWENLWTTVPCLNFCETISESDDGAAEKFRNFVNRALMLWEGTEVQKFEIDIRSYFDESLASDLDLWVLWAVKKRVEELSIRLVYDDTEWADEAVMCITRDAYIAPRCLSTCTSIKKLSLEGCSLRTHDGFPTWDKLESLKMDGFCFSEDMINQILSGSPRLEEFELHVLESYDDLNIQSRSLKKLKIEKYLYFESDEALENHDTSLRICTPNLETLEISGCLYSTCLFTDVSSLTDATLGFDGTMHRELLAEALRQLLPTIQRVEKLALSVYSSELLGNYQRKKLLSPLPNVKLLKITDESVVGIEYGDVMNLLEIFPNMKMLVIDDCNFTTSFGDPLHFNANHYFEFETDLPKSFMLQLKTIHIMSPFRSSSICRIIVFLLRHASMLENLLILTKSVRVFPQMFLFELTKILSSLPRSSPTAKVTIQYLSR